MSCTSNNATPPGPAFAPGVESIDPAAVARRIGQTGVDPRLTAILPAFDAPFFQAGLAGYSDAAMRIIARRHGCPFCVTEALLDRTLLAGGRGFAKADLGELHDNIPGGIEDHPLACQIMGSDPSEMAASALKVAEQGRRPPKHYRLIAYENASPELLDEVRSQHLRTAGGQQIGRFDPTEGLGDLGDDSCDPLDHSPADDGGGEVAEWRSGEVLEADASTPSLRHSVTPSLPAPSLSFEVIDINLACPVKKIKSKSRGGHWLTDPKGAIEILQAVRDAVPASTPCTVKLRRSFDDTPEMAANFEIIFDAAYAMGYAWTTVHARTVEQKYIGPSRWTFLRDLVQRHPDKIIFGSGDVWEVNDIFRMIGYTGVSGVSVARGCIGNPWIFRQARQMMAGEAPTAPTIAEQRDVLEEHFRLSVKVNGEGLASRLMRKFAIRFAAHHPEGETVRLEFIRVQSIADWRAVLARHYA
ncbi:MAG: tRNA-dihydrouridine synthase family protein [Phycisphaerales bacterium]|nr:tRNA-dihydrouridine synthase family protein [Phycisphaerales bacterium]